MPENQTFQLAVDLIEDANSVLLTTHIRPDGDACGCVRAMMDVNLVNQGPVTLLLDSRKQF